jgi:glycosyltransferase involved in cell wall biosynthesis
MAASGRHVPPEYGSEVVDLQRPSQHADGDLEAAIIVIVYRTPADEFRRTLRALDEQTVGSFELIVVDNGTAWDIAGALRERQFPTTYARLAHNAGVTVARNLGAELADAPVLVFLDDDGLPREDFVQQHLAAHCQSIVAARGRIVPPTDTVYNRMQSHYDLGDEMRPYVIDIEGNTSFDRETFRGAGGYDETLTGRAGHEGRELSHRLLQGGVRREELVYHPDAVIYHDYATGLFDYVEKQLERRRVERHIERREPELFEFDRQYESPGGFRSLDTVDRLKMLSADGLVKVLSVLDHRVRRS